MLVNTRLFWFDRQKTLMPVNTGMTYCGNSSHSAMAQKMIQKKL